MKSQAPQSAQIPPSPAVSRPRRLWLIAAGTLLTAVVGWYSTCYVLAKHHLHAAELPLRRRDFQSADQHLAWCRWAWPSDPQVWLVSARAARRGGRFDESLAWLRRAESAGARRREILLERLLGSAQQGLTPDLENALQEQLHATRTDFPAIAEVLTGEYMRLYRLPDARAVLNRWVELDADDVEPWIRRAWVAEHQLDFGTAVSDYRKVLDREPQRHPVRLRIAEILFKMRKPADAVPELEYLIQQQPSDVAVALALSRCQRELGHFDQASAVLSGLPETEQAAAGVRAERGQIALAQNRFAEAESLLRESLRELPREREILYGLQQSLTRQGKNKEAEEIQVLLKQVDFDGRRMGELISALAREPGNADLRFEGAMIFLRNGMTEDGVRWLQMTLDNNPRHVEAHRALAEHYQKSGRLDRAAGHLEAVRKLSTERP